MKSSALAKAAIIENYLGILFLAIDAAVFESATCSVVSVIFIYRFVD